jgi:hypothetical protein
MRSATLLLVAQVLITDKDVVAIRAGTAVALAWAATVSEPHELGNPRAFKPFLTRTHLIARLLLDKGSMDVCCSGLSSPRLPSLVEWLYAGVALI